MQNSISHYIEINPSEVGMFKYLLESYDNLALFTVLDKQKAILKVFCAKEQEREMLEHLEDMQSAIFFEIIE